VDDLFWGKIPRKRVKWMSYDSGIPPVLQARPGASDGKAAEPAPRADGDIGYYFPMKENTRRFDILRERQRGKKAAV
jgi:hypothetical protein